MNDEIYLLIDSYIDGELNRKEEDILFEQLALNSDARDYFRRVNLIRNQTKSFTEEFPSSLEKIIVSKVRRHTSFMHSYGSRITGYIVAGISVMLLIISLFLLSEISGYRDEINSAVSQMNKQNEIIEALYNSLPPTVIRATYSNEIIVKPNI